MSMPKRADMTFSSILLDGLYALLPIVIVLIIIKWLWQLIVSVIQPFIAVLFPEQSETRFSSAVITLIILFMLLYIIGIIVNTRTGRRHYLDIENSLFKKIPGYVTIKEMVTQIFGAKKASFSKVALVTTFQSDLQQIAFITDEQRDSYTVFVPTGPNPTSGNIFIMPKNRVKIINVPVEAAMKTIIGCGTGSTVLIERR
jgi:uncharacterized membrane protein